MESLLDFSRPLDIQLFDQIITAMYMRGDKQAESVLVAFQSHPQSWTRVDFILENSRQPQSRYVALNVLEDVVKTKWQILPANQKDGIKNYVIDLIIKLSSDAKTLKQEELFVNKLNMVLVQIVKQEWPHNWPSFIPDLVKSSKTSQSLCANNMHILLLLSEEIFDYSNGQMTSEKMKEMKKNLNKEFTLIYQLCEYILDNSIDAMLLSSTLKTLLRFLHWIPVGYIFETSLIPTLAMKFFPTPLFQNATLECLNEIGGLTLRPDEEFKYAERLIHLYFAVIQHVSSLITPATDLAAIYARADDDAQQYIRQLAIFITSFLKAHLPLVEQTSDETRLSLTLSLSILVAISRVDDSTVFKICLEYWSFLVVDLYNTMRPQVNALNRPYLSTVGSQQQQQQQSSPQAQSARQALYAPILSQLRLVMITRMARPEEVLVVEDESGNVVREQLRDTETISLYKSMKDCLVYLTHLDPRDCLQIMQEKLTKQVDGTEYTWHNLNTLCWAFGSINGALDEASEKSFLVKVIKDLLYLCEKTRGKDHKAIIASNIMYVVGQYPRFLKQHWKFLKTVVNKLFEFMHEKHPGVQDMSVETFLKIAHRCAKKFVVLQQGEAMPFIDEILQRLSDHITLLEPGQTLVFYEACGVIIQSETDDQRRQALVFKLMEPTNTVWSDIILRINQAQSVEQIADTRTCNQISNVLKVNTRLASSLGSSYVVQLARLYTELLNLYACFSRHVTMRIAREGERVVQYADVRAMRAVKRDTLVLLRTYIANSSNVDRALIQERFLPPMLECVLAEYQSTLPDLREHEVLALFAEIVSKQSALIVPHVRQIFEAVFGCTLEMITKNFQDYPDHRINFFRLLHAINVHAFPSLLQFNAAQFSLIMNSIVWAMKHIEKNIADTGLEILNDLLTNISRSEIANEFYKLYYVSVLSDIIGLLTDTLHKPGFRLHCVIISKLIGLVDSGAISAPLWDSPANPLPGQYANNQHFVRTFVSTLLQKAFPNLTAQQIESFVKGLFTVHADETLFKTHVRDFLVELKEFSKADNEELFREERAQLEKQRLEEEERKLRSVPGLLAQEHQPDYQYPVDHLG